MPPARFDNAADWLRALGDVPLDRIVFDPWPGTASEEDLLRYVERDKRLCELIEGTLVEKPVGYLESYVASILLMRLNAFVLSRGLGAVTGEAGLMRLAGGRVRMPDVAFVSSGRLPGGQVPTDPVPSLAPDLAAEVLSESNTPAEMEQKLREYFASGTRLVWFVDPRARTVAVYDAPAAPTRVLGEADALDGMDVVPGFVLPVADLFRNVPRPQ